jgi:hypothetical protein
MDSDPVHEHVEAAGFVLKHRMNAEKAAVAGQDLVHGMEMGNRARKLVI